MGCTLWHAHENEFAQKYILPSTPNMEKVVGSLFRWRTSLRNHIDGVRDRIEHDN